MASGDPESVVLPQFFPAHWLDDAPDIVFRDFPSRIRIGYVLRAEGCYEFLMRPQLNELGLDVPGLHASALRNLRALPLPRLKIGKTPGGPEAYLTDDIDNFAAVRILLPDVQQALSSELGNEFFAAIPCRDWCFCWSKSQSVEWQTHNFNEARRIFSEDDYNLTPDILLYSQQAFSLHAAQGV